jgi:hypothetical protein
MSDEIPSLSEFAKWVYEEEHQYPVVVVATYRAREVDDHIQTFIDRQGWQMLPSAVRGTMDYLCGRATRRMAASKMGISAVEGIAITQAVEKVVPVVADVDPDVESDDIHAPHPLLIQESPLIRLADCDPDEV